MGEGKEEMKQKLSSLRFFEPLDQTTLKCTRVLKFQLETPLNCLDVSGHIYWGERQSLMYICAYACV